MKQKEKILMFVLMLDLLLGIIGVKVFLNLGLADMKAVKTGSDVSQEAAQKPGAGRFVALTFDDGPHPRYTKKLLDGLREKNVKVSFFLIGKNIEGNEELIKQMSEDGHLIGTHCYEHEDLTKKNMTEACEDILKTNQLIEDITGKRPEYIRPPYGNWNEELENCVQMTPVFWSIDTLDWKTQNSAKIIKHIEKNVKKHQTILLHDVFATSVDAALTVIDTLTEQGYTFVTVDELLID